MYFLKKISQPEQSSPRNEIQRPRFDQIHPLLKSTCCDYILESNGRNIAKTAAIIIDIAKDCQLQFPVNRSQNSWSDMFAPGAHERRKQLADQPNQLILHPTELVSPARSPKTPSKFKTDIQPIIMVSPTEFLTKIHPNDPVKHYEYTHLDNKSQKIYLRIVTQSDTAYGLELSGQSPSDLGIIEKISKPLTQFQVDDSILTLSTGNSSDTSTIFQIIPSETGWMTNAAPDEVLKDRTFDALLQYSNRRKLGKITISENHIEFSESRYNMANQLNPTGVVGILVATPLGCHPQTTAELGLPIAKIRSGIPTDQYPINAIAISLDGEHLAVVKIPGQSAENSNATNGEIFEWACREIQTKFGWDPDTLFPLNTGQNTAILFSPKVNQVDYLTPLSEKDNPKYSRSAINITVPKSQRDNTVDYSAEW